jgi:hypothetical protein
VRLSINKGIRDGGTVTKEVYVRLADIESVEVKDQEIVVRVASAGVAKEFFVEELDVAGRALRRPFDSGVVEAVLAVLEADDFVDFPTGLLGGSGPVILRVRM